MAQTRRLKRTERSTSSKKTMQIILFVVIVLFLTLLILGASIRRKVRTNTNRAAVLQEQILSEEQRTEEIDELEKYMKSDEYIEQVAKEKLGMVKDKEIIFKEAD